MPRSLFRALVVGYVLANIAAGLLTVRPVERTAMPLLTPTGPQVALGGTLLVLGAASVLGLLRFWRPARPLFVGYLALAVAGTLVVPPVLQTPLASAVTTLSALLAGVVAGVMFTQPVAAEFGRAAG